MHLLTHGPMMSGSPGTLRTWPGSWSPVYPRITAGGPPKITVLYPEPPEVGASYRGLLFYYSGHGLEAGLISITLIIAEWPQSLTVTYPEW